MNLNKYNKLIALVVLCQLLFVPTYAVDENGCWCEVREEFEDTKLFTSPLETQYHFLDNYFKGYNLDFEISLNGAVPDLNEYKVIQGVDFRNSNPEFDEFHIPIAQDHLFKETEDSQAYFALLTETLEGTYRVKFGSGQKTQPAYYDSYVDLPEDENMTCLGVVILQSNLGVVDCVNYHPSTQQSVSNHYYIVSTLEDHEIESIEIGNNYLNFLPLQRKTIKYITSHDGMDQIFLLQGVPFDLQEGEPLNSYLTIYRYVVVENDQDSWHNGHLQINAPITGTSLGFGTSFRLSDFDSLGDWIYVLDHTYGVAFFEYKHNKIEKLTRHLSTMYTTNRWGISVSMLGSEFVMVIAEDLQIVEYHMTDYDSDPVLIDQYRIENPNIGTVSLQSNQDYIVLQQGRFLTVFDRGVTSINYTKAQIQDAELFYLWYSNNIYVFHYEKITNYLLSRPALKIKPQEAAADVTITIKATSRSFDNKKVCHIDLISVIIPEISSKSAYYSNYNTDIEWNLQTSLTTILPLDVYWYGPNIAYKEKLQQSRLLEQVVEDKGSRLFFPPIDTEKTSEINEDSDDNNIIIINEAGPVQMDIYFEKEDDWYFTEIIPNPNDLKHNAFYAVHQDKDFLVSIFSCVPNYVLITEVYCGEPVGKIKEISSVIQTVTFGSWGDEEEILAIVEQGHQGYVKFFYMKDDPHYDIGELWFQYSFDSVDVGFGNKIQDIILSDRTLFAILEGKSERFVMMSSYNKYIQHRGTITQEDVSGWPQIYDSEGFYPEELVASEHHKNVLFIKSRKEIFVVSIQNHTPMYLHYVNMKMETNVEFFVTEKSLIIAQIDSYIKDYAIQNINWLSQEAEFQYQTYEYEFCTPFAIAHGPNTGLLYVLAHTVNKSDLNLMIYRTGVENIRTLVKVIKITEEFDYDQTKPFSIDVGGYTTDFIFIQYNGNKKYYRSPMNDSIILIPQVADTSVYVDLIPIYVEMHAWDNKQHDIEHFVTIVNGQTVVKPHYDVIAESLPEAVYANNKNYAKFTATNVKNWWEGSVIDVDITCSPNPEVCTDENIKLTNIVSEDLEGSDKLKNVEYVVDMLRVDNVVYYLYQDMTTNDFIIGEIDSKLDILNKYNDVTSNNSDYICEFLVPVTDTSGKLVHFVVICSSFSLNKYVTQVIYEKGSEAEEIPIAEINSIPEETIYKNQYQVFHDMLFVNCQSTGGNGGLYIYDLYNPVQYTVEGEVKIANNQVQLINHYSITGSTTDFYITSFFATYERIEFEKSDEKYVKLILADSPPGFENDPHLYFLDLEIENNFGILSSNLGFVDYTDFVLNRELFVNQYTQVQQMKLVMIEEYTEGSDEIIYYKFIILTSNTAMYETEFHFKVSTTAVKDPTKLDLGRSTIINVYNNYGSTSPVPFIDVYLNTIVAVFQNIDTTEVTIAFYELQNLIQDRNAVQPPLHTMEGGITFLPEFSYIGMSYSPIHFALISTTNDFPELIASDLSFTSKVKTYNYYPNQLTVETFGDFPTQKVSFNLNNVYSSQAGAFNLSVEPGAFKPDDPEGGGGGGSSKGWIIALCVIAGLLLLGGIGFWIWKKKQNGEAFIGGRSQLEGVQSDAGYSLQENIKN